MNFAKNSSGFLDNNMLMMLVLLVVLCPNILSSFGDNTLMYLVLFFVLSGGFGM